MPNLVKDFRVKDGFLGGGGGDEIPLPVKLELNIAPQKIGLTLFGHCFLPT